jgi:hypothetical protein
MKGLMMFGNEINLISAISAFVGREVDCLAESIAEWYVGHVTIRIDTKKREIMFVDGCIDRKTDLAITALASQYDYYIEYGYTANGEES